ncbi:ERAP1-like C-terminal domain-containing protein [Rhodoferax sp. AJA081-3]|uniref:M1 family metallopeptidase n=1 Tax=Rhodoferax sp. AJA081-3 TaxID=2752316 RepID=UPI001ADF8003|nr:M1 family metallopeptidase [Rhodoferax sp. AJA081-3]QTN29111.1 ERAP1-like C-terminal domain-containing protein [Rhodoferax sp. AJA081-3]
MKLLFGFVLLAAHTLTSWAAPQEIPLRLPKTITPTAYQLALTVDPNQTTHSGEVNIAVDITKPAQLIRLHAVDITLQSAVLTMAGKTYTARAKQRTSDVLDLTFAQTFPTGKGQLRMVFTGRIEEKDSQGLFRQQEGGDWYAFTQFESISARQAFPSFDEPGWKVPWTLSLTVPQAMTAVANTPVVREVALAGGQKRVDFQTTKALPSYLLAFGVGPFDILDGGMAGNTPVRFITPRGRAQDASFAASVTPAILAKLEAYFGMPYPYEKLDTLVLPLAMGFSAMEHPGLVTFVSLYSLSKPGEETVDFKRTFVEIQAHELAHMWFGNLVTMAWWDDLWLNESFASWMAEKIAIQMGPELHGDNATQSARAWAMQTDRLLSTSQIYQPVSKTFSQGDPLGGQVSAIVYGKGQATLAMFETWLGEERFQAGVRRYMAKHAWGNATGEDFVAALAQGDKTLAAAFKTFTHQPGIPRVAVELKCDGQPRLELTQSRFLPAGVRAPKASLWWVPVTVRTPSGTAQMLLKDRQGQLPLPDKTCPAWVQANAQGSGYYRAVYSPGKMAELMAKADLTEAELMANLNDVKAMVESGDLTVAESLAIASRFVGHAEHDVAESALKVISNVEVLLEPQQREAYARVWQSAFGAKARQLGLLDQAQDSADDRSMRATWLPRYIALSADSVLTAQATSLAQQWLKDKKSLPAANRALVLRAAAYHGDRAYFDALTAASVGNPDRRERADIYAALASFRAPALAQAARDLWLSPQHDIRELMAAARVRGGTEALREGMFDFVTQHFDALAAKLPKEAVTRFPNLFDGACSVKEADRVDAFFTPLTKTYTGLSQTLSQSLESVRICARYRGAQHASLQQYLNLF